MAFRLESDDEGEEVRFYFKRSNALRIKSNDLRLLPDSIRKSLFAIGRLSEDTATKANVDDDGETADSSLSMLEQIKRGVKLKSVSHSMTRTNETALGKGSRNIRRKYRLMRPFCDNPLGVILLEVLSTRYMAMQPSDDEDNEDDDLELVVGDSNLLDSCQKETAPRLASHLFVPHQSGGSNTANINKSIIKL